MRLPVVAIVGRPNVGKSTLFNRLARRRISIVEDTPGVTRDRLYAESTYDDLWRYTLIDTGGFEADPETQLFAEIREQSQLAIDEADVVLLVVDARAGVTPADTEVARLLRRSGRPLVVAANKVDSPKQDDFAAELYELGVGDVFPISAEHGRGIADLMDAAFELLPETLQEASQEAQRVLDASDGDGLDEDALDAALDEAEADLDAELDAAEGGEDREGGEGGEVNEDGERIEPAPAIGMPAKRQMSTMPEVLRICVIGKPNVGKSSLVNRLLGEERHLVSDIAGTTIDAVDSLLEHGGQRFRMIDTAGIRRKRSISHRVEKFAVVAALKGMDRADVAVFLLDATLGLSEQDLKVAAFAHDKGRAMILAINKWDLAKENEITADKMRENLRDRMPFLAHVPIRFISAKTGRKVFDLLDLAVEIGKRHFQRHSTSAINRVLEAAVAAHPPPVSGGKRVKLYFAAQVATGPPTIVIACNDPRGVHFSYRRFLLNQFRDRFDLEGTPLRLIFRRRGDNAGRLKNLEARKRTKRLTRQGRRAAKPKHRAR